MIGGDEDQGFVGIGQDWGTYKMLILDSKYDAVDPWKILADSCTHLTQLQRDDLAKYTLLFNRKLRCNLHNHAIIIFLLILFNVCIEIDSESLGNSVYQLNW